VKVIGVLIEYANTPQNEQFHHFSAEHSGGNSGDGEGGMGTRMTFT
jgi:hypothetical protein